LRTIAAAGSDKHLIRHTRSGWHDACLDAEAGDRSGSTSVGVSMNTLIRSLSRSPGLVVTAVLLLALGIGATTALFSVVHGVLLAPLPYQQPERLVRIWTEFTARGIPDVPESPANVEELRRQATSFVGVAGINSGYGSYQPATGEPRQVQTATSTWDALAVLGVTPQLGRGLTAADGAFSAGDVAAGAQPPATAFALPRAVLISDRFWHSEFNGASDAIGRFIDFNGNRVEVVGVLPAGFRLHMAAVTAMSGWAPDPDVWMPLRVDLASAPPSRFLNVVGRLRDGVTPAQALDELRAITGRLYEESPAMLSAGARIHLAPYAEDLVADVRTSIWALLGAACLVLLIACANVASLLLMRAAGRSRELAVRHALGAGRTRLLRQLLGEAAALAALGALGGLLIAWLGLHALLATAPANIARLDAVSLDVHALGFALLAALATTLLAGLLPAWTAARATDAAALRERSGGGLAGGQRLRFALVAGEVALSFVLLVGAGLMLRSAMELARTDTGFVADGVLTVQINLPNLRYPGVEQRRDFIFTLQERLEASPRIQSAAATTALPLSGLNPAGAYTTEPPIDATTPTRRQANYRIVTPDWFETMRTPLIAGRTLNRDDEVNGSHVVVIDDVFAAAAWPGEDPIGRQLWLMRLPQTGLVAFEVVGVVRRQLQASLHEAPRETAYFAAAAGPGVFGASHWALRINGHLDGVLAEVRREVAALDPALPLAQARPMQEYVDDASARTRFALQLIGVFAGAALMIAVVGLYAAIRTVVSQRRAEIGLRMSLGARAADIFGLFVRRGVVLATVGIGIGLLAALVLSPSLTSLLVGVSPTDSATYAVITLLFVLVAAIASALPALAATRVQPMAVLRDE
jgi:predicted permease